MADPETPARTPCPPMIHELVDRFRTQIDAYKTQSYNETQVRREFIDPMFTALAQCSQGFLPIDVGQ